VGGSSSGHDPSYATQHYLDCWLAHWPTTCQHAARFVHWATKQRLVHGVTAARFAARTSPTLGEDERHEHLRRVLLDDILTISHRMIAVLVLLFGQPLSRIVQLHVDASPSMVGTLLPVANPSDVEARLAALEAAWRRWPPTPWPRATWPPPATATLPTSA